MAFKMRGNPFKQNEESKEDKYARIIKEYSMIQDGGRWIDPKTGRTPSQIASGVKGKQRRHILDVEGNLIEE